MDIRTPSVRSRMIEEDDLPAVVALLCEGFPERPRSYWEKGLARLGARAPIGGCPKYGLAIDADGVLVGIILLIYKIAAAGDLACNVSSWYVRPAYRVQASMLVSVVFKRKDVTFSNISPASHTIPILAAQGYTRYSSGQFIAAPALAKGAQSAAVEDITAGTRAAPHGISAQEFDLLRRHAGYGCISLVCTLGTARHPFVFAKTRVVRKTVPVTQLIYCRSHESFVQCAPALGLRLLKSGRAFVILDANGPIAGLPGSYQDGRAPKYYRGPAPPALGDLSDTEYVIFGP